MSPVFGGVLHASVPTGLIAFVDYPPRAPQNYAICKSSRPLIYRNLHLMAAPATGLIIN